MRLSWCPNRLHNAWVWEPLEEGKVMRNIIYLVGLVVIVLAIVNFVR